MVATFTAGDAPDTCLGGHVSSQGKHSGLVGGGAGHSLDNVIQLVSSWGRGRSTYKGERMWGMYRVSVWVTVVCVGGGHCVGTIVVPLASHSITTELGYSPMLTPLILYHKAARYNLTTLCLNGTFSCVLISWMLS